MNYYKRHLGDYAKDTGHLTALEHGIYNLLLDHYYSTEKPIPIDRCERIAKARTEEELTALENVQKWFFKRGRKSFKHCKCDEVIAEKNEKSLKAQRSAAARWNSERNANASKTQCEGNASHKPITNNHKKEKSNKKEIAGFDEFWLAYPNKKNKAGALKAWQKINPNQNLLATIMDAIKKSKTSNEWMKDSGEYIPHPATWLNGQRWEDVLTYGENHATRKQAGKPESNAERMWRITSPSISPAGSGG